MSSLSDQKLEAETKKLRAEALKLEAEARKLERDHQIRWRVASIVGASLLLAIAPAVTVYVVVKKNADDDAFRRAAHEEDLLRTQRENIQHEAERQARRWRSQTGSFEFAPERWEMGRDVSTLPLCDSIQVGTLPRAYPCMDPHGAQAALCREAAGATTYRRLRCWVALPSEAHFPEPSARAFTAAITAFDFDTSSPSASLPSRHPRLQVFVPDDARTELGFEIAAQVWGDTVPWMVGLSWTASGRVAQ